MAIDLHFYKGTTQPNAPSGSLWFNPNTKRIYLFDGSGSTVFGSDVQSAKYANNTLTITNFNGSKIDIPISSLSSEDLTNALVDKLNKIKVNNTIVNSTDLNFIGGGNTTVSVDGSNVTISSPETIDASKITGTVSIPTASSSTIGGIKVGSGLTISSDGTLSATGGGTADSVDWDNITNKPTIPNETSINSQTGNFTLGAGLTLSGKTINCTVPAGTSYTLPTATSDILGGIKVGAGLSITSEGILSATGGGTADSVEWENVVGAPKNVSDFNNDAGYITHSDLPSVSDGTTFTPSVSASGVISWTNDGGKTNPDPVNIKGPKGDKGEQGERGDDGTGVSILGSYNSESELPSYGSSGDAYLINGDLYVWSGSSWTNVGSIQGPQGPKGDKGDKGDNGSNGSDGAAGVGITDITSTENSWSGAKNIITITLSDGTKNEIPIYNGTDGAAGSDGADGKDGTNGTNGTDGVGISSISSTNNSGSGAANTVTVTLTNGKSESFTVYNGTNGTNGTNGKDGTDGTTLPDSTINTINTLVSGTIGTSEGAILCGSSGSSFTSIGASSPTVSNGEITASAFYESSDENLKWFTGEIPVNFKELKTIPKQYFVWRNRETPTNIGTSAQKVQKIYPEIVNEAADGHLTVDYGKLSIVALKAIDLLNEKIERLEAEIKELKSKQ